MSSVNFFNQYSYFFQKLYKDSRLTTQHVSLYLVLFYMWNKHHFPVYVYGYRKVIKQYSKIGSHTTYYKCLRELSEWGYIVYYPSNHKREKSKIKIVILEKPNDYSEELLLPFTDTELYQGNTESYQSGTESYQKNKDNADTIPYHSDTESYPNDTDTHQVRYDSVSINRQTLNKTYKDSLEQNKPKEYIITKKLKNENIRVENFEEQKKEKKVPPKKEKILGVPFSSPKFQKLWEKLLMMPKWKNKPLESITTTLNQMEKYEEQFVIELLESAISGNWQGIIFPETDMKYSQWLQFKHTKNGNTQSFGKGSAGGSENTVENKPPQRNYKKRF